MNNDSINDNSANNSSVAELFCDEGKAYLKTGDNAEAIKCFVRAVRLDSTRGMVNLGYCFENGLGTPQDLAKSFEWYEKAAKLENPVGQRNLGNCYKQGIGVSQDLQKAVFWFTKAAEQGNGQAQNDLADCYDKGYGVTRNPEKAFYWYEKAAKSKDPWGICNLATCYAEGTGTVQNPKRAFELFMEAAGEPMNYPLAQYSVGACYYHGIGVPVDAGEAIIWFKKAADQGHEAANENLQHLVRKAVEQGNEGAISFFRKLGIQV